MAHDEDIEIDEAPTSIDPYATLGLAETATQDEIKTAYRKAALKNHPDKVAEQDKQAAHSKFQKIAFAYAVLSDERRRKRYDTTGRTEDTLDLEDDDFDWTTFFREQFANVVTAEKITSFADSYKGSEEEAEHVLAAYKKHQGNMSRLYQDVMLSDVLDDDERFRGIIDAAIESGRVEAYDKYTQETEKQRNARMNEARKRRDKEGKEAAKEIAKLDKSKKKGSKGSDGDLAALIQQRQKGRAENFFDALEAKYAPKNGKSSKKRAADEPPEEAFAQNRAKGKGDDGGRKKRNKKS